MKRPLVLISALAAASMAACGGGTSGNFVGPTASSATVAFIITVPPATTTQSRHAQFTAPSNTQSVSIALTSSNGNPSSGTPTIANLTSSTPGCTSSSGLTCTVNVTAPVGNDVFTVSTFSQPNAQGTSTGVGNLTVTAQAGTTTNAPTTLGGTIASVALSLPQSIPEGQSGSVPLLIQAKDANGNVILGTYNAPIALTLTDASKHSSLSAASVADSTSGSSIKVVYDGSVMTTGAAISASVSGIDASKITGVTFLPDAHSPTTGSFTYADVMYNAVPSPSPSPVGTITESFKSGASFGSLTGLVDETWSEAYTGGGSTDTSDSYFQWVLGSSNQYELVGLTDNTYGQFTETCQAPYAVLYATNTSTWSGTTGAGPCTHTQTFNSGTSTVTNTGVFNSDGSSTSTSTNNTNANITKTIVNSDGTAVQYVSQAGTSLIKAIYTPAPNSATIPVFAYSTTGPLPSPFPSPSPANTTEPNFYATAGFPNGQVPHPLNQDSFKYVGATTLPAQCNVSPTILGSTNPNITEYDENFTSVNPFFAVNIYVTKNYLLNGVGVVCTINTDSEASGQSFGPLSQSTEVTYLTASSLQAMLKQHVAFAQAMPTAGLALATRSHRIQSLKERAFLSAH